MVARQGLLVALLLMSIGGVPSHAASTTTATAPYLATSSAEFRGYSNGSVGDGLPYPACYWAEVTGLPVPGSDEGLGGACFSIPSNAVQMSVDLVDAITGLHSPYHFGRWDPRHPLEMATGHGCGAFYNGAEPMEPGWNIFVRPDINPYHVAVCRIAEGSLFVPGASGTATLTFTTT